MAHHRRTAHDVDMLVGLLGPGPWTRRDVLAAGWTTDQLRRAVQAGRLRRLQRGVLTSAEPTTIDRARAALATAPSDAVISHRTAAELQGLWLPSGQDPLIHVTVPGDPDDTRHGVRVHGSGLPSWRVTLVDGLRLTTAERSAVDTARGLRLPDALVVLDSFARLQLPAASPFDARSEDARHEALHAAGPLLRAAYAEEFGWPGSVVVRDALPLVDPASESPFESWSRGYMVLDGLPAPALGARVVGASGRTYWADFLWSAAAVIAEADGLGKYGTDPDEVRRALADERLRQADLESAGYAVVRWSPLEPPRAWLARLARALRRRV